MTTVDTVVNQPGPPGDLGLVEVLAALTAGRSWRGRIDEAT